MEHKFLRNIFILLNISIILFYFTTVQAADNQFDYEATKTRVNNIQNINPSLPSIPGQEAKGSIGYIISKIFDSNGKIGNWFLRVLGVRTDGRILRWSGGNDGQLVNGSIYDNGTNIGIGGVASIAKLHITGVSAPYNNGLSIKNGNQSLDIMPGFALIDGTAGGVSESTTMTIRSSGSSAGNLAFATGNSEKMRISANGNIGIGKTAGPYKLDVNGNVNISGTLSIGGGIGGDSITDNTIDATELEADSVGASELANNSVASANIINGTITNADIAANTIISGNIANNTIGETAISDSFVARNSNLLDGYDSTDFLVKEKTSSLSLNAGWYTIATNSGNRASAKFAIRDTRSGSHQTVHFYAAHHYGAGNTINILSDSSYSGGGAFRYIRIKEASTYAGALLQIYIDKNGTAVYAEMFENIQSTGWTMVDWLATDPISGLTETIIIDLDANNGIQVTDSINSQEGYKVDGTVVVDGNAWIIGDRIQQGSIDSSEIQDNTLTASDLATDSVGISELANNSVASVNIIGGAIVNSDINSSAAIAGTKILPNFGSQTVFTTGKIGSTAYTRSTHNTGHLEGSYNNIGANSTNTNPIYTIGSSYNPSSSTLGNMYGIGYAAGASSYLNSTDLGITPLNHWGMYVAADGNARVFLDASSGHGYFKGNVYAQDATLRGNVNIGGRTRSNNFTIDTDIVINNAALTINDASRYVWTPFNGWGTYWDTSTNTIEWNGGGVERGNIDLDNGNFQIDGSFTIDSMVVVDGNAWVIGDRIQQGSIDSSEIQDNTLTANDLAPNSVAASELAADSVGASELANNSVASANIINDTITESDISNSFKARDSNLLDNIDSSSFLRSDADDYIYEKIIVGSTNNRRAGMYGSYSSTKVGHIWSMGSAYQIPEDGSTFGNLYGLAYKHTNNTTGGAMAGGHQMVWNQNGTPYAAMGTNIWTRGAYIVDSTTVIDGNAWIIGDRIQQNSVDSSEIQDNSLTASDLAADSIGVSELANNSVASANVIDNILTANDLAPNSVGNSELIDQPIITQLNIASGTDNGIKFWSSDNYEIAMGNGVNYQYGPVQDFSIKMNMNNDTNRGWTWGVNGIAPKTALDTEGDFQTAGDIIAMGDVGIGLTNPSSKLEVAGKIEADEYCDRSGNNCKTVEQMGGSIPVCPINTFLISTASGWKCRAEVFCLWSGVQDLCVKHDGVCFDVNDNVNNNSIASVASEYGVVVSKVTEIIGYEDLYRYPRMCSNSGGTYSSTHKRLGAIYYVELP